MSYDGSSSSGSRLTAKLARRILLPREEQLDDAPAPQPEQDAAPDVKPDAKAPPLNIRVEGGLLPEVAVSIRRR